MGRLTPKQIIDHINLLSNPEQIDTLTLLARQMNVEVFLLMLAELPADEQERFAEGVAARLGRLARQMNQAEKRAHLQKTFEGAAGPDIPPELILEYLHDMAEAEVNARRNRQPSAATITKNVAMCDAKARRQSLAQIAKRHRVSKQHVSIVLKEEARWRKLAKKGQPTC
jgi:hypothetical protein